MTWVVPDALEEAVRAAARDVVGAERLEPAVLARAIVDRSRRYTSDRAHLAAPADPRGDLAARAAFFTIADAIKVAIPLGELAGRGALPAARPLRVVDLGAGCGAMSLGIAAALAPAELAITAIDRDADALRIAAAAIPALAAATGGRATVATRTGDVGSAAIPAADLVVLGGVLNELPPAAHVPLVERALAQLAGDGALIVVEPALRDTARAVHALRDAVLGRGLASVFAPCTRSCAPCPALADPDDWCHEDRAVVLPPRTAELARTTHLRDAGLKFAYLVLRRAPLPLVEAAGAWRIVSAPRVAKGKLELFGCSDAGRVPLRLLKRHRAPGNRAIERAGRGDVVVVAGAGVEDGRVEIDEGTSVERIEPAEPEETEPQP